MEEKELTRRYYQVFDELIPALEQMQKGFFGTKEAILKEGRHKFLKVIFSRLDYIEDVMEKKEKNAYEKKYIILVPIFQKVASGLENLSSKMESKLEGKILFSEKAMQELTTLYDIMMDQFKSARDYLLTGNGHLKDMVMASKEKMLKLMDEYATVHQQRLVTGVCMPKASYLYLDMTDSFKRIARGLNDFIEKV